MGIARAAQIRAPLPETYRKNLVRKNAPKPKLLIDFEILTEIIYLALVLLSKKRSRGATLD